MTPLLVVAAFLAGPPQPERPLAEFGTAGRSARQMAFSPDGQRLAVVAARSKEATVAGAFLSLLTKGVERNGGDHDRRLFVWDVAGRKELARLDVEDVRALAFSADGRHLAVASSSAWRRFVTIWDLSGARPRKTLDAWWDGETSRPLALAFAAKAERLAAADGAVRVWDLAAAGKEPTIFGREADGIGSVALSPDGKALATGSDSGEVRLWDATTGKPLGLVERGTFVAFDLAFAADGKTLTYRTIAPGKRPQEYRVRRLVTGVGGKGPVVREDRVVTAAELHVTTPDGKARFEPEAGGAVVLRQDGKPAFRFRPHPEEAVPLLAVSPDGKTLATGGNGVKLWDVAALRRRASGR
jgi:WD40 repeat protein